MAKRCLGELSVFPYDRLHRPVRGDRVCSLVVRVSLRLYFKKSNFKIMTARRMDFSPNFFKE